MHLPPPHSVRGVFISSDFGFCDFGFCLVAAPHCLQCWGGQETDCTKGDSGARIQHGSPGEPPSDLCHSLGHRETSEAHWRGHTLPGSLKAQPVFIVSTHYSSCTSLGRKDLFAQISSVPCKGSVFLAFLGLGAKRRALVFETDATGPWQE